MDVAVMDFSDGNIHMFKNIEYIEYDDVEEFVYEKQGFSPDETYIMCDNNIEVIYEDNN